MWPSFPLTRSIVYKSVKLAVKLSIALLKSFSQIFLSNACGSLVLVLKAITDSHSSSHYRTTFAFVVCSGLVALSYFSPARFSVNLSDGLVLSISAFN